MSSVCIHVKFPHYLLRTQCTNCMCACMCVRTCVCVFGGKFGGDLLCVKRLEGLVTTCKIMLSVNINVFIQYRISRSWKVFSLNEVNYEIHWAKSFQLHVIALTFICLPSGQTYLQTVASSRQKIAKIVNPFLRDGTVSIYVNVYQ